MIYRLPTSSDKTFENLDGCVARLIEHRKNNPRANDELERALALNRLASAAALEKLEKGQSEQWRTMRHARQMRLAN